MWLKMKNCEVLVLLSAIFVTAHGVARNRTKFQAKKPQPMFIDDEHCFENPDVTLAPHQDCSKFWGCDEFGAFENDCEPGQIFDTELLFCGEPGEAICDHDDYSYYEYPDIDDNDDECPQDSDEVIFLPSEFCDEYYICINGRPVLFVCREGQHWNKENNYCDDIHSAGCDDEAHPPTAPDCPVTLVGTVPHPKNCNWFWFCDRGNRSLQQCQHLFHYDIAQKTCVFMNQAVCVKNK